jgi:hypothetical protein
MLLGPKVERIQLIRKRDTRVQGFGMICTPTRNERFVGPRYSSQTEQVTAAVRL